ncbi:MAG: hypothetical protein JWO56_474 [Acidobacteria bacterium]|nr:hypothetical protein [Acidobacteriota bacterium]
MIRTYALWFSIAVLAGSLFGAEMTGTVAPGPLGAAVTLAPAPAITITLATKTLTVSNVTSGGRVVLLGLNRESTHEFFNTTHYADVVQETGGTQSVTFKMPGGIATHSVWVVADIATGRYASATPAGSRYRPLTLPVKDLVALVTRATLPGKLPDLALVRPGVGAWVVSLEDAGGIQRRDAKTITFDLPRMRPLTGSPPAPSVLALHDLVIGIDPETFQYFTIEVGS